MVILHGDEFGAKKIYREDITGCGYLTAVGEAGITRRRDSQVCGIQVAPKKSNLLANAVAKKKKKKKKKKKNIPPKIN